MSISPITISCSAATLTRSLISSTRRASPRPTRRVISRRPLAPSPALPPPAARRFTSWCTRRICGRITIGGKCCLPIAKSSLRNSSAPARCRTSRHRIVFERALTPQDINDRYHVLNGAIYGLASHGRFLGAFKPGNRSPDLRGLYLAGGAAHPGPGMPMVLMSGWIAADALDKDGVVGAAARTERGLSEPQPAEPGRSVTRTTQMQSRTPVAYPPVYGLRQSSGALEAPATSSALESAAKRTATLPIAAADFLAAPPLVHLVFPPLCAPALPLRAGLALGLAAGLEAAAGHLLEPRFLVGRPGLPRAQGRILSRPHRLCADRCRDAGTLQNVSAAGLLRRGAAHPSRRDSISAHRPSRPAIAAAPACGHPARPLHRRARAPGPFRAGTGSSGGARSTRSVRAVRCRIRLLGGTVAGNPRALRRIGRGAAGTRGGLRAGVLDEAL